MAPPSTPDEWLNVLAQRHDAEKQELELYDRYYEGTQPLTYMHPEIFREVQQRIQPVVLAWPQLVVDAVEERLDVEGFRLPDQDAADDDLWRVWQANDLDELSQQGHLDALVMRRAYACVGTNEDDEDTPIVTVESPLEMYADIDPRTRKVRAALRRVAEVEDFARINERLATLYLPDETVWYRWDGSWKVEDKDEHKLGDPPVSPLVNRGRLQRTLRSNDGRQLLRYGRSDLDAVIPLSNAANKLATDMMVASEFVALPLRGFWGMTPDDLKREDGTVATALEVIMGRMLLLANEDGNGKEFQFPAADLSNFHNSISQLARLVASLAGLPPHYLGMTTENPASADAIRSAESRLVKRAERKQRAFGGGWERVGRLVKRFQEGDWAPQYRRLETVWRDASTPTKAQSADAATKLFQAKITPWRQTVESLGYSQVQIDRMQQERDTERASDPVAEIARGLVGPQPPQFQTADSPGQSSEDGAQA